MREAFGRGGPGPAGLATDLETDLETDVETGSAPDLATGLAVPGRAYGLGAPPGADFGRSLMRQA